CDWWKGRRSISTTSLPPPGRGRPASIRLSGEKGGSAGHMLSTCSLMSARRSIGGQESRLDGREPVWRRARTVIKKGMKRPQLRRRAENAEIQVDSRRPPVPPRFSNHNGKFTDHHSAQTRRRAELYTGQNPGEGHPHR